MASIFKIASGWRAQVRIKGKPTASKVHATRADAVRWARDEEYRLDKSRSDDPMMSYARLYETYSEHARKGAETKQRVLAALNAYWGGYRLPEITTSSISDYAARRKRAGAGPSTILQELTYLGSVLEHGGILSNNEEAMRAKASCSGAIKTLRVMGTVADSEMRERRPTEDELIRLEEYFAKRTRAECPMFDIVLFAICTCMRRGEIVSAGGILWKNLDILSNTIWVRGRKDTVRGKGVDDLIPLLVGPVTYRGNVVDPIAILLRQRTAAKKLGRIFPYAEHTVTSNFATACNDLSIEDLHFHDLRHDGISRLFEFGYDIPHVSLVSGHRSWKHLRRYTNLKPTSLHHKTPTHPVAY